MKILIVSATSIEIEPLSEYLMNYGVVQGLNKYQLSDKTLVSTLVTGVGGVRTAFGLANYPNIADFNLLINVGIAGAYHDKLMLVQVVNVVEDQFGDIGIEERNGEFQSVFSIGLEDSNAFPFTCGKILNNDQKYSLQLAQVSSISFNTVAGESTTIVDRNRWKADIESMEGAAFAYAAKSLQIPYLQLRSISNYIIPRDKSQWQMKEAIENLNNELINFISILK